MPSAGIRGRVCGRLGFAMVRLDGSIVNVALPRMGASFGVEIIGLQWVVDA
jgi:DHA2 family methylenomycin A resistance protein-like MFS transporter